MQALGYSSKTKHNFLAETQLIVLKDTRVAFLVDWLGARLFACQLGWLSRLSEAMCVQGSLREAEKKK